MLSSSDSLWIIIKNKINFIFVFFQAQSLSVDKIMKNKTKAIEGTVFLYQKKKKVLDVQMSSARQEIKEISPLN